MDDLMRQRYDRTWSLFEYEHPSAYWLRSNGHTIVCTRCARRMEPPSLDEDPSEKAESFVTMHLKCPLGYGLREGRLVDPIFAR